MSPPASSADSEFVKFWAGKLIETEIKLDRFKGQVAWLKTAMPDEADVARHLEKHLFRNESLFSFPDQYVPFLTDVLSIEEVFLVLERIVGPTLYSFVKKHCALSEWCVSYPWAYAMPFVSFTCATLPSCMVI